MKLAVWALIGTTRQIFAQSMWGSRLFTASPHELDQTRLLIRMREIEGLEDVVGGCIAGTQ